MLLLESAKGLEVWNHPSFFHLCKMLPFSDHPRRPDPRACMLRSMNNTKQRSLLNSYKGLERNKYFHIHL